MRVRKFRIALIGFGNSARRLAGLLLERAPVIRTAYQAEIIVAGIATGRHGSIIATRPTGIDLKAALACLAAHDSLNNLAQVEPVADARAVIARSDADIVVETTPLDITAGEPALTHIKKALGAGKHVVTANKGPLAFGARTLHARAAQKNLALRYESTVMDGLPIFNLVRHCLPLAKIRSARGIINSTTNYILTVMEAGGDYDQALAEAQARGIAEAEPSFDIDGWDAAVKLTVLANCLMSADIRPGDVARTSLREIDPAALRAAHTRNEKIRLVAEVERDGDRFSARVAPVTVLPGDLLYVVDAFSSALLVETDLMGTIGLLEANPDITQTAYGLLSDLISIISLSQQD